MLFHYKGKTGHKWLRNFMALPKAEIGSQGKRKLQLPDKESNGKEKAAVEAREEGSPQQCLFWGSQQFRARPSFLFSFFCSFLSSSPLSPPLPLSFPLYFPSSLSPSLSPFLLSLTFGIISSLIFPYFLFFLSFLFWNFHTWYCVCHNFHSHPLTSPMPLLIHDLLFNYYYIYGRMIPFNVAFVGLHDQSGDLSLEKTDCLSAHINCLQLFI